MENLVRSAIAPDTMVAAVAQNTVWNIKNPSIGKPLSMILFMYSRSQKWGVPATLPTPNMMPKPTSQKSNEPTMKSTKFFIKILAVFFVLVKPASTKANPGCMKNTSIAASSIHTVLTPVVRFSMIVTVVSIIFSFTYIILYFNSLFFSNLLFSIVE